MADSDSLPLQGPPQPAPAPRAHDGPPPSPTPAALGQLNTPWTGPFVGLPQAAADDPQMRDASRAAPSNSGIPGAVEAPPLPTARPATIAQSTAMPAIAANSNGARAAATGGAPFAAPRAQAPAAVPSGAQTQTPRGPVPLARPAVAPVATEPRQNKEEESIEERAFREAPSWLISALVHMVLLIILGLIWAAPKFTQRRAELNAIYADQIGDQLVDDSITTGTSDPDHADKMMITPNDLQPVDDPFAAPKQPDVALDGSSAAASLAAPTIGLALSGRQEGMRQSLLGRYGGNKLTEKGVQLGLEFLSKQQRPDGSWSLKGPYSDGAYNENAEAATAMSLLAFQGNGNTHKTGTYKKNVAAGVAYLLKVQGADGNFYQGNRNEWMYTHAQCTIALCELYGMTKDSTLRLAAEKATQFCVEAQDALGGWRYRPRQDSDTSVTGWVVMALQSARMAGLTVPPATLERVSSYLDKASPDGGSLYAYQPVNHPDEVMTAEALLCRQYLGWNQYDPKLVKGVEYVGSHLPNWNERNVYYWYYGTQVMHHMGGAYWKRWNDALRDMLVEHQVTTGPEKGSWDPKGKSPDAWAVRDQGGRLYVTCLSLYMLEVYYRHLPIYAQLPGNH